LIQLLQALEQYLGGPIVEYFDWISGTSTGGILALLIASGTIPINLRVLKNVHDGKCLFLFLGKSIHECKKLYFRFKDQVFVGKRPYDADALEGFLRNEFGDKTMTELNSGPKYAIIYIQIYKR